MRILLRIVALAAMLVSCAATVPVAEPFDPIAAHIDPMLNVTSSARIEPGFSMGVWHVTESGPVRTLTRQMLIGDETSQELNLALEFSDKHVSLVDAYQLTIDADGLSQRTALDVAELTLNHADPQQTISGRLTLDSGTSVDFWVDMDDDFIVEPEIDTPFVMQPGSIIDEFSFAIQFIGVVDDSRCPADVTCIWAGEVTLEFAYVDEDVRTSLTTTGISTADGPMFGGSPTIDLDGSRYLEILNVVDQSATVVIRTNEG